MRGFIRLALGAALNARAYSGALALGLVLWVTTAEAAPERVVSINLCTDQIAMMLAAPGQLVSISNLASDPLASSMVEEAAAYPQNRGSAEQVYLLHPDLVLAGEFTSFTTVDLLHRLGVEVLQVPVINALDEVPDQLRLVASALGQEAAGEELATEYERNLVELTSDLPELAGALYYPNGYTTGGGTVADDVLRHAGFYNIAERGGLSGGGFMPLETLVLTEPRMIVTSRPYAGASRSEEILRHPALSALGASARVVEANDGDWLCGTPYILRALALMRDTREALAHEESE